MVIKRKILISATTLLVALSLTLCLCGFSFAAHAEGEEGVDAQLVRTQTDTVYHYLDEPLSIAASDTNIYVTSLNADATVFTAGGAYVDTLVFDAVADKVIISGASIFTLKKSKILSLSGDEIDFGEGEIIDASGYAGNIFALKAGGVSHVSVSDGGLTGEVSSVEFEIGEFIAASGNNAFISAKSGRNSYLSDIYLLSDGNISKVFSKAPSIESMVSPADGVLVTLQSGELCKYELKNGMLRRVNGVGVRGVHALAASGDLIYALTGDGAVMRYDLELDAQGKLIASASETLGFYRNQSNISTRKSALLVSDFGNDRVVRTDNSGTSVIDYKFIQPAAAVSDNLGNIYVAHNMDNIDVFDSSLAHIKTITLDGAVISDLKFDPLNTLYALTADGRVYRLGDGEEKFSPFGGETSGYDCIAVALDGSTLYAMNGAAHEICALSDEGAETLFTYFASSVSFTLDIENSFYLLNENGEIVKYFASGGYAESDAFTAPYTGGTSLRGANVIIISTVKNDLFDYGDIIISDPVRHCVRKVDGKAFGVKVIDDGFTPPVMDNLAAPISEGSIVRTAIVDVDVYEKPMEMSPVYTVAKGRKVLVLDYDTGVGAFAQVYVDDVVTRRAVTGYVYKAQLSAPLEYSAPEAEEVTVYNHNTPIYKLPSRHALKLNGYDKVAKDTRIPLLDFVKGYADDYEDSQRWYRVALGSCEGYIAASDVSVNSFEPIFIRPQTNAVILSVGGSTGAPLYNLVGEEYVMSVSQPLVTGTRVEVVGTFDASERYTQIKYFDAEKGTLVGYVETVYLKYDGVGILPVVVIILLLLTVIAIVITVIWRNVANKKKLTKA